MSGAPRTAVLSEPERLAELHAYQVLDTEPEPAFDGLVRVAAAIAEVPTVLVSLVDSHRQWFKARIGQDRTEGDRESAFCDWVVRSGTELVVPDATTDPRFAGNPLVTSQDGIRFYAGFPLRTPAGAVLGTLCVIDRAPRQLSGPQFILLSTLADQVMALLQSRRQRLATEGFLATMGQELRTPMNAVLALTGRLLDTRLDPDQRELLEAVRSSGDHLLTILDDILDCSMIESGDLELDHQPFELRETVEGTVAQFAGAAGELDLISHLSEDCPAIVVGDVVRLRQVLSNLVGNAVRCTEHGDVLLRAALDPEQPDPQPDGKRGQVRLRFTVADTGIGIAPGRLHRLFASRSPTTGLGLAISRAIVEAMGGELTATSTLGTGSEFTFSVVLGRADDALPSPRPGTAPGELAPLAGRSVLVVEDNNTNRQILRLQLEGYGMVCTTSSSPSDALALVGSGRSFDLAILDFSMPTMDGGQLATALRRLPTGQRLPLVLLTGLRHRDQNDDRLFAAVLAKPTRRAPLFEAITRILTPGPIRAIPRPAGPSQPSQPREAGRTSRPRVPLAPTRREGDRKLRILLAEDNEVSQKLGKLMLSKIGHQVDIADNGLDALEAVRHNVYDVVLMDLHMPVMDGLESTRRIRADLAPDRQPHIIALTASTSVADQTACTQAGMDGYLPKPVCPDELATVLAALPVRPAER